MGTHRSLTRKQKGEIFQIYLVQEAEAHVHQTMKRPSANPRHLDCCSECHQHGQGGGEMDAFATENAAFHLGDSSGRRKTGAMYAMEANKTEKGGTNGGIDDLSTTPATACPEAAQQGRLWMACSSMGATGIQDRLDRRICKVRRRTSRKYQQWNLGWAHCLCQPYVILGDMNVDPSERAATNILGQMEGELLATGCETTCQGELDWAIVSKTLQPLSVIEAVGGSLQTACPGASIRADGAFQEETATGHEDFKEYPNWPIRNGARGQWDQLPKPERCSMRPGRNRLKSMFYRTWRSQRKAEDEDASLRLSARSWWTQRSPGPGGEEPWPSGDNSSPPCSVLKGCWKSTSRTKAPLRGWLIWNIPQHWQGEGDGTSLQEMCQLYTKTLDDDEYFMIHQQALHQEQMAKEGALNEEAEEYRKWLHNGYSKGYRALFKNLKQDQTPYLRPFQDRPLDERLPLRVQQWQQIWATQEEPIQIPNLQEICRRGQQAARELPPLHPGHIHEHWENRWTPSTVAGQLDRAHTQETRTSKGQ